MDNTLERLDEYRAQIDDLDQQLITFLAKRFELSKTIGMIKRDADVRVYQPGRAQEVQARYVHLGSSHGIQENFVRDLFQLIHEESCRIQCKDE